MCCCNGDNSEKQEGACGALGREDDSIEVVKIGEIFGEEKNEEEELKTTD